MSYKHWCAVIICSLSMTLSASRPAVADSMTFMTDVTWRSIGPVGNLAGQNTQSVGGAWENANLTWNSSLDYDDSDAAGWGHAFFNGHTNIPNSIWPSGDSFSGPTPAYFRKIFTIPGTPTLGTVDFVVDDDVQMYVNGNLIFNDTDGLANFENGVLFSSSLVPGENLIAMKAHDKQGTEGIGATFRISFEPIPEPTALTLTAFGLLGLVARGRRRRTR